MNKDFLEKLSRELADQGKLIAAGFVGLRMVCIAHDAPQFQIDEMQMAFMAGAQHLFASIMTVMDSGSEPTAKDLERMDLIDNELREFAEEFGRRHGIAPPSPRTQQ